jgi:uroporphyrinogen decarboxylase
MERLDNPTGDLVTYPTLPVDHPLVDGRTSDAPLVAAAQGRTPAHTPVWFMRQAGRSLPEYRKAREGVAMLDACFTAEHVIELTMQPVRRYGVDAAILFSDIVVPLRAVGVDVDIVPGVGPVMGSPIRTRADLDRIGELDPSQVEGVLTGVRGLVAELGGTPLIGFAGAPFTLASYLVEGGPSRDHAHTKALMHGDPQLWSDLLARIAAVCTRFLQLQIENGASAVQLFDSWVGALPLADYEAFVRPHSAAVLDAVAGYGVPRIHFGVVSGELLGSMGEAGADVVGVDFRVPLDVAATRVGPERSLQGNLDPALLFAPWEVVQQRTLATLDAGRAARGHIFNLGHGVLPDTDPDVLHRVTDLVHDRTAN